MAYYNTCIECGANLDPGEICDCQKEQEKNPLSAATEIRINGKNLLKYTDNSCLDYITDNIKSQGVKL